MFSAVTSTGFQGDLSQTQTSHHGEIHPDQEKTQREERAWWDFSRPGDGGEGARRKKKRSISEVALVLGRLVLGYLTPQIVSLSVHSTLPVPTPLGQTY